MVLPFIKRILILLTGNPFAQSALGYCASKCQYLMGIGSASDVGCSGEVGVVRMVRRFSHPPYCIFDVGANKGQFLNMVTTEIGPERCIVHCFEPASDSFNALKQNAPKSPNIVLNKFGLGKKRGTFSIFYDEPGSGSASLTKRRLDHFGVFFSHTEQVQIDTVDNYCRLNNINHIDLLKIDVEGHEMDVLLGATHMFEKGSIGLVNFEFGGCNIDTRTFFQDFFYWFKTVSMKLYRITPSGYVHPLPHYLETYEQFRTTNFLAIHTVLDKQ